MDEKYMEWLDDRIASTALQAVHSMQDARLTLARDDHPLLAMLQSNSRPPYVKDPYLFVMQLKTLAADHPIATLVNWSDHPETLGGHNTLITADFPHWLCQYLENHDGGTAVFFQGSIGGLLSTLGDDVALQDPETGRVARGGTWRKAELVGLTIGQEAPVDTLLLRKAVVFTPLDNDHFRAAEALNIFKGRKPLYTEGRVDNATAETLLPGLGRLPCATGHDLQTEVEYIQLLSHDQVLAEITTVPGEIYPELVNGGITRYPGADFPAAPFEPTLRAHLHSRYQFIFGLANDELGYIIPKAEWDNQPPWLQNKKDRWYGEVNSAGEEVAGAVTRALVALMEGSQ
jgi:hypothetical protein